VQEEFPGLKANACVPVQVTVCEPKSMKRIRRAAEVGKDTFIYQFGDHDPSGVLNSTDD